MDALDQQAGPLTAVYEGRWIYDYGGACNTVFRIGVSLEDMQKELRERSKHTALIDVVVRRYDCTLAETYKWVAPVEGRLDPVEGAPQPEEA
jgi:hypothetical protein